MNSDNDRDIVEWIFDGTISVNHDFSDRFAQDFEDALQEIIRKYDELKEREAQFYEAEKHIDKLEAMLDRRKVRYKKWGDGFGE